MKKSLFALAAVTAFAGAAQAQSSVTVYGIMDAGVASISNTGSTGTGRTTGLQNGGLSSPRLGFKGSEDLGGGKSANFVLEAEVLTADGQTNGITSVTGAEGNTNGQFFNRASWVGLSDKKLGEMRLGLQNTSGYDNVIEFDGVKGANLGGAVNVSSGVISGTATNNTSGNNSGNNFGRIQNSYAYYSPKIGGFSVRAGQGYRQQSAGVSMVVPNSSNTAGTRITDIGARFDYKKASVALSYATLASGTAGASETIGTSAAGIASAGTLQTGAYASYDFGVVKATTFYTNMKGQGTGGQNNSYLGFGLRAPVTPRITVGAQYTGANIKGNATGAISNANSSVTALAVEYALSKRTTAYAIGAMSSNQTNGKQAIASSTKFSNAAGATGTNQTGYMVGVRHTF